MKVGLVLEGGGMRGMYTVGVLDYFMENNISFPYVVGVSAGACNGISFVSNQKGRNYRINTQYITDKRYLSLSNFVKTKSFFGMDFLFDIVPNHLDIFDREAFLKNETEFKAGATNIITGNAEFFSKEKLYKNLDIIRASSSIPLFSPKVYIDGLPYLDGGTSCPIPIKQAFYDGCDKVIVVLTRERGFVKAPEKFRKIYKRALREYPKMVEVLDNRHIIYNETLSYIEKCEKNGTALVLSPKAKPQVSRFEKSKERLTELYNLGFGETKLRKKEIEEFL